MKKKKETTATKQTDKKRKPLSPQVIINKAWQHYENSRRGKKNNEKTETERLGVIISLKQTTDVIYSASIFHDRDRGSGRGGLEVWRLLKSHKDGRRVWCGDTSTFPNKQQANRGTVRDYLDPSSVTGETRRFEKYVCIKSSRALTMPT